MSVLIQSIKKLQNRVITLKNPSQYILYIRIEIALEFNGNIL